MIFIFLFKLISLKFGFDLGGNIACQIYLIERNTQNENTNYNTQINLNASSSK